MSETQYAQIGTITKPFVMDSGLPLASARLAYKTYGKLNADKSNAILLFHVLTSSHHAAGIDKIGPQTPYWTDECHLGWWDSFIGENRALDTSRYFIVCANYLGGCYGSTGPSEKHFELTFSDIVNSQMMLIDQLGIDHLHAVIGPSVGGFMAVDLALRYAQRVDRVVSVASGIRVPLMTRITNMEQIMAIESQLDPQTDIGCKACADYLIAKGKKPSTMGLLLARMIALKTYFVPENLHQHIVATGKAASAKGKTQGLGRYQVEHPLEQLLFESSVKFTKRFDPQSYLAIINAWQQYGTVLDKHEADEYAAFAVCRPQRWLVYSIDSDQCMPPDEQDLLTKVLQGHGLSVDHVTITSDLGHDSFLREPKKYLPSLQRFLAA